MKLQFWQIFLLMTASSLTSAFEPFDDVFFMLFTRSNPYDGQRIGFNVSSILNSNWNSALDVRFLIHGWVAGYRVAENVRTTEEFLKRDDYNVIAVDWSAGAYAEYEISRWRVGDVGLVVGTFIDFLYQHGFTLYHKVNLIGHSLGGQIAGHAGKNTQYGKINAIFATDPATRLFEYDDVNNRLDSTDADYTEAIITSELGFREPITHAQFYANWGLTQPGCENDVGCNHHRATEFYSESVNSKLFIARQCANFDEIESENCPGTGVGILGGDEKKDLRGVFFIETNDQPPFARG